MLAGGSTFSFAVPTSKPGEVVISFEFVSDYSIARANFTSDPITVTSRIEETPSGTSPISTAAASGTLSLFTAGVALAVAAGAIVIALRGRAPSKAAEPGTPKGAKPRSPRAGVSKQGESEAPGDEWEQ